MRIEPYHRVRDKIADGDVLLFRGTSLVGRFGDYSHAAVAAWWGSSLMLIEMRAVLGGRVATLASALAQHDGQIDVYRPQTSQDVRTVAARNMRRLAGCRYGWWQLLIACLHQIGLRSIAPTYRLPESGLEEFKASRFCSEAVCWAYQRAGYPLTNKPPHLTAPFELIEAPDRLHYLFTLAA